MNERSAKQLAFKESLDHHLAQHERAQVALDQERLERFYHEKLIVAQFEADEQAKHERAVQTLATKSAQAQARAQAEREAAAIALKAEQDRIADAEAKEASELEQKVNSIMISSGTCKGPQRSKTEVRALGQVVVRFAQENDNMVSEAIDGPGNRKVLTVRGRAISPRTPPLLPSTSGP